VIADTERPDAECHRGIAPLHTFTGDLLPRFNPTPRPVALNLPVETDTPQGAHLLERVPVVGTLRNSQWVKALGCIGSSASRPRRCSLVTLTRSPAHLYRRGG